MQDLDANPPVKFDLARKVRVFNARFSRGPKHWPGGVEYLDNPRALQRKCFTSHG
jgi:hypothetical protein